jgi:S1-C subfamily serine protease
MKVLPSIAALVLSFNISYAYTLLPKLIHTPTGMMSMGSGYFINEDGYIATAAHVINPYTDPKGKKHYPKKLEILYKGKYRSVYVVATDQAHDVAILKLTPEVTTVLKYLKKEEKVQTPYFTYSTLPKQQDLVYVAGFPSVFEYGLWVHTTWGKYDAIGSMLTTDDYLFFMNTRACHGNSGGAALNNKGEIVGTLDVGVGKSNRDCYQFSGAVAFSYTKALADKYKIKTYKAQVVPGTYTMTSMYFNIKDMIAQEKVVFIVSTF